MRVVAAFTVAGTWDCHSLPCQLQPGWPPGRVCIRIVRSFLLLVANMYNFSFQGKCMKLLCNLLSSHSLVILSYFPKRGGKKTVNCVLGDRVFLWPIKGNWIKNFSEHRCWLKNSSLHYIYVSFFFFFLAATRSMRDLISLTRDWTCTPCSGSAES